MYTYMNIMYIINIHVHVYVGGNCEKYGQSVRSVIYYIYRVNVCDRQI